MYRLIVLAIALTTSLSAQCHLPFDESAQGISVGAVHYSECPIETPRTNVLIVQSIPELEEALSFQRHLETQYAHVRLEQISEKSFVLLASDLELSGVRHTLNLNRDAVFLDFKLGCRHLPTAHVYVADTFDQVILGMMESTQFDPWDANKVVLSLASDTDEELLIPTSSPHLYLLKSADSSEQHSSDATLLVFTPQQIEDFVALYEASGEASVRSEGDTKGNSDTSVDGKVSVKSDDGRWEVDISGGIDHHRGADTDPYTSGHVEGRVTVNY